MSGSPDLKLFLGELAAIETRLAGEVAVARGERPLDPVAILVENTMLAPYLRHRLAFEDRGHINLHIMTPARFAEKLSSNRLAEQGRRPLPKMGDRVLARRVAETTPAEYFRPVRHTPGFADSLRRLFRDLAQAGIDSDAFIAAVNAGVSDPSSKIRHLARLYRANQSESANFYSAEDAFREIDTTGAAQRAGNSVLIYGLWNATGNQRRMFRQLLDAGTGLRFFLPMTGTDADEAHADLRSWLLTLGAEQIDLDQVQNQVGTLRRLQSGLFGPIDEPPAPDGQVRLLSAPDPPREVREAARTCLRWAEEDGIPFHLMAVVYRHGDPYRALIDQIFSRAGIVTYLHSGRPLTEHPIGQRLVGLLNLADADLPRTRVMEFLTETLLPVDTLQELGDREKPVQMARWDQLSREAGIVEGREQWSSRLELLATSRREFLDPENEERSEKVDQEIAEINHFQQFIEQFAEDLESLTRGSTWTEHLATLTRVASRYVSGIGDLLDSMSSLERLDEIDAEVPYERFRESARFWISQQDASSVRLSDDEEGEPGGNSMKPDRGRFATQGVNVIDIGSLRHLRFDAVIILGVAERQFPPPSRQDPLLLDRERAQLNAQNGWVLPLRSNRAAEEMLTFSMAVAAANRRLQISFPRSEAGSARSYLPSHFYRSAASVMAGHNVEAGAIDALPPSFFTRIPAGSFLTGGAADAEQHPFALDAHEYDRALIERNRLLGLRTIEADRPNIARARAADHARRISDFTEFDGAIPRDLAGSIVHTATGTPRPMSPSRIETYATCPFRFFLRYALGLEKVDEPELLERISPLDRGSVIHEILERFMNRLAEAKEVPAAGRRAAHLEMLLGIADELFDSIEQQGLVGYRVLWEHDRIAIYEDLEEWYDLEVNRFEQSGLIPEAFELRFGWSRRPDEGGKGSRDDPFRLSGKGRDLFFTGRVDRVDVAPDHSRFLVIDYKTGGSGWYRANTFNGGRAVQLPIYLMATSDLLGIPWTNSQAEYLFPTRRGDFQRVELSGPWLASNHDDFIELVSSLVSAMEQGLFPQVPKIRSNVNCRICDFKDLCPAGVERIASRKRRDERVFWLRQLIGAEE